jgi:hypothetical protein
VLAPPGEPRPAAPKAGSAIENAKAGSAIELQQNCRQTDARTDLLNLYIKLVDFNTFINNHYNFKRHIY